MALATEQSASQVTARNQVLDWLTVLQQYAAANNWEITIRGNPQTGISVDVAHDAPAALRSNKQSVPGGSRQTVYQERF
jgi:hypothetical protein